jgi:hypothetical protein
MFQNHIQNQTENNEVKAGDVLVVYGHQAKVESVFYDPETARTQINLDWGAMGKSKVFAHDEGKTWVRLKNFN